LLREASLFICDEVPMIHIFCFEAFSRTMHDLMRVVDEENLNKSFGGKFEQIMCNVDGLVIHLL